MKMVVEQLKLERHRGSTQNNYYGIWKNFNKFNKFVVQLDEMPNNWEDRLVLYVAFLIKNDKKSTTIKSYVSAIKAVLFNGGIQISEDSTLLAALTQACKLKNDRNCNRLLIRKSLLGIFVKMLGDKFFN